MIMPGAHINMKFEEGKINSMICGFVLFMFHICEYIHKNSVSA